MFQQREELAYWSRVFVWQTSPHGCYAGCYAVLLEHVERGGGGGATEAASLSQCTQTAQQQENIRAVKTSRPSPTLATWSEEGVFLCQLVISVPQDAFRTLAVLCTVIVKDKNWPKHSFSLILPVLCTASVDPASCCSGVICDEVFIVYTGCCQLRCLKYLTIIIYY